MKISQKGIEFLEHEEGIELEAYLCPAKIWTIGIGSTLYPNLKPVKKGDRLPDKEAAYKLLADTAGKYEKVINENVKVLVSQEQFDALFSFTYNLGVNAFKNSTLLKRINAGDPSEKIKIEFMRWVKSGGKIIDGLVQRRSREANLFINQKYS